MSTNHLSQGGFVAHGLSSSQRTVRRHRTVPEGWRRKTVPENWWPLEGLVERTLGIGRRGLSCPTASDMCRTNVGKARMEQRHWWQHDNHLTGQASGAPRKNWRRVPIAAACVISAVAFLLSLPSPAIASTAAATENIAVLESLSLASATPVVASPPLTTLQTLSRTKVLLTKAELTVTLRLLYAALGGAAVGLERSSSDRPAGVRTMALVSLGAASFTLCSMYGFLAVAAHPGVKVDPSRMASSVVSGVGFIGAGVITNNRKSSGIYDHRSTVNGLTTAAAIWVSAAVGVASGVGLYYMAGAAALSTIGILKFGKVKEIIGNGSKRVLRAGKRKKKMLAGTRGEVMKGVKDVPVQGASKPDSLMVEDLLNEIHMQGMEKPPASPHSTTGAATAITKKASLTAKQRVPKDPHLEKYLHGFEDGSAPQIGASSLLSLQKGTALEGEADANLSAPLKMRKGNKSERLPQWVLTENEAREANLLKTLALGEEMLWENTLCDDNSKEAMSASLSSSRSRHQRGKEAP